MTLHNENIVTVYKRAAFCAGYEHGARAFNSDSFLKADRVSHLPKDSEEANKIIKGVKILKKDCTETINYKYNSAVHKIKNHYISPKQKVKVESGILPKRVPLDNGRQAAGNLADMWLAMRVLGSLSENDQKKLMKHTKCRISINGIRIFGNRYRRGLL